MKIQKENFFGILISTILGCGYDEVTILVVIVW